MKADLDHALHHLNLALGFIRASGVEIPKATVKDFDRLSKRLRKQTERLARTKKRFLEEQRQKIRRGMQPYQGRRILGLDDEVATVEENRLMETVTLAAGAEEPRTVILR